MKPIFYAAAATTLHKQLAADPIPEMSELITFLETQAKWGEVFAQPRKGWVIDSSAFSIFKRGLSVTLSDYIDYLNKVFAKFGTPDSGGNIIWAAGLDVIGNPIEGDKNQLKMEAALPGLPIVPCYHRGDSIDFLKTFLARNTPCVAIGGMAIADEYTSAESLFPFLDAVYREICDKDGKPRIKTHLFGVAAVKAVARYPCTSYDASAWMQPGIYGAIMLPKFVNGKPDWLETMVKIPISNESQLFRKADAHYKSMRAPAQEAVKTFVNARGFEIEELAAKSDTRNLWNLKMAIETNKNLPDREKFDHMDELDFNFL